MGLQNHIIIHIDGLLLRPGPRPWTWTQNQKNLENLAHEKRGKQLDAIKKERPHSIIYYDTKILQEETCNLVSKPSEKIVKAF